VASQELDCWILSTVGEAVAYACSLLHDRAAAEDVVQECYCRLLARADVYNLPRDGRKLLFRAVTNACLNHRSRQKPILRLYLEDEAPRQVADRRAHPPEDEAVGRELERAVAEGLAQLPEQQRVALELKSLGHPLDDIAQTLGITANHAGVLVHRARHALAEILAPYLEDQAI
jgi:RNA polymerase sigma-70 factor (ECF subfamily)